MIACSYVGRCSNTSLQKCQISGSEGGLEKLAKAIIQVAFRCFFTSLAALELIGCSLLCLGALPLKPLCPKLYFDLTGYIRASIHAIRDSLFGIIHQNKSKPIPKNWREWLGTHVQGVSGFVSNHKLAVGILALVVGAMAFRYLSSLSERVVEDAQQFVEDVLNKAANEPRNSDLSDSSCLPIGYSHLTSGEFPFSLSHATASWFTPLLNRTVLNKVRDLIEEMKIVGNVIVAGSSVVSSTGYSSCLLGVVSLILFGCSACLPSRFGTPDTSSVAEISSVSKNKNTKEDRKTFKTLISLMLKENRSLINPDDDILSIDKQIRNCDEALLNSSGFLVSAQLNEFLDQLFCLKTQVFNQVFPLAIQLAEQNQKMTVQRMLQEMDREKFSPLFKELVDKFCVVNSQEEDDTGFNDENKQQIIDQNLFLMCEVVVDTAIAEAISLVSKIDKVDLDYSLAAKNEEIPKGADTEDERSQFSVGFFDRLISHVLDPERVGSYREIEELNTDVGQINLVEKPLFENDQFNIWYRRIIEDMKQLNNEFMSCFELRDEIREIRASIDVVRATATCGSDHQILLDIIAKIEIELKKIESNQGTFAPDAKILNSIDPDLVSKRISEYPPVGIYRGATGTHGENKRQDCFAIASFQCILSSPKLTSSILEKAINEGESSPLWSMSGLIAYYYQAQEYGKQLAYFDSQQVKECSSSASQDNEQADAADFIRDIIDKAEGLVVFNQYVTRNGITEQSDCKPEEAMIPLDLSSGERDFDQLVKGFFISQSEDSTGGIGIQKVFSDGHPPFLVINVLRYGQNGDGGSRISDDVENVPLSHFLSHYEENWEVDETVNQHILRVNETGEKTEYRLTGCTIHFPDGENLGDGGHYVSLVRKGENNWYLINDQDFYQMDSEDNRVQQSDNPKVQELLEQGAQKALRQGCQFFYEKVEIKP